MNVNLAPSGLRNSLAFRATDVIKNADKSTTLLVSSNDDDKEFLGAIIKYQNGRIRSISKTNCKEALPLVDTAIKDGQLNKSIGETILGKMVRDVYINSKEAKKAAKKNAS